MDDVRGPSVPSSSPAEPPAGRLAPRSDELGGTVGALLEAFISISSDLDTDTVLSRIVASACELTGAKYGAMGVLGYDGRLADVVTHGVDPRLVAKVASIMMEAALLDMAVMGTEVVRVDDLPAVAPPITFPNGRTLRTLLMAPIRVRGTPFGQLYLTEKLDGGTFDQRDETLVRSLASVAGFVIENARAYGLSERRRRWLEMLGRLTELLTPPITLDDALQRIAAALLEASKATSASVVQVPPAGTPFAAAVCGTPIEFTSADNRRFGQAVRTVIESGDVLELVVHDEWLAVLAPLRAHLTVPGVLILTHPLHGRPDTEEHELLSSFADQAALALDRTQALADREEMAVISDRDRIARDLHDVVIQRLFATGLHLQSIRAAAPNDELRERIDKSVKDLDQTIRDIRSTIFELRTRPRNSVRADVREVVQEVAPRLGFLPSVEMTGPVDTSLDLQIQQQMVSVLREALGNVARHAQATEASVELQVTATHLRLRVTDDGVGIPEDRTEYGLRNARRRAALLGGNLDLWPNDPSGTIFVWSVPLPQG